MKATSLTLALLFSFASSTVPADDPLKQPAMIADLSVCTLSYGGYGECISELPYPQVTAAPAWDIAAGPPPLLPKKAEAIASAQIAAFVAPYASRPRPLLFSHWRTRLIKSDETHWFYGITFTQRPSGGSTGGWPGIEVFVTFDGKVGTLKLTSPPKDK